NDDGVLDTLRTTYTLPASVESLDEVALFLSSDDREHVSSFCRAEIRPFKAKFTVGRTVQLDIPVWNLVRPLLYKGFKVEPI
ncbi:hypothetical protein, partial [Listeria monocytogenes]|uniref:hypothetical protein n=1 Tax=Listeria monocytogenes TaxID=1639 RepID=UPI002FDBC137